MWIKRLTESENKPWATVISSYLKVTGGIKNIGINFDHKNVSNTMPSFYITCLKSWSCFADNVPSTAEEVLMQPIWNNNKLTLSCNKSQYSNFFHQAGINIIKDLYQKNGNFKLINQLNISEAFRQKYYIHWQSIINSVPQGWKNMVKHNICLIQNTSKNKNSIVLNGIFAQVESLTSKQVYHTILSNLVGTTVPTSQTKIESKYKEKLDWLNIYSLLYLTTLDTYNRQFQYRILHNYICVNENLSKWKVLDSNRCSLCFIEKETVEHIFCLCPYAITFYAKVKQWCASFNIELPALNFKNVVLCNISENEENRLLKCLLMLIYKKLLFAHRSEPSSLTLCNFIRTVDNLEVIEYKVAQNKGKLLFHLKKWCKYLHVKSSVSISQPLH